MKNICDICGREFFSPQHLTFHLRSHTSLGSKNTQPQDEVFQLSGEVVTIRTTQPVVVTINQTRWVGTELVVPIEQAEDVKDILLKAYKADIFQPEE